PPHVVVGVHAHAALEPFDRLEQSELLVVADGALGQADLRGKLADAVLAHRRGHACSPPRMPVHVNWREDYTPRASGLGVGRGRACDAARFAVGAVSLVRICSRRPPSRPFALPTEAGGAGTP